MTTIQDLRKSAHAPQRSYSWEIEILAQSILAATSPVILTARAENITIPEKAVEMFEINHKSRKMRYHGRDASPGTFTVQFWDDEAGEVYKFFERWFEVGLSNSFTGAGLTRQEIEAVLNAKLLGHDEQTVTGIFTFGNVWPSSLGDITLSYDSSDKVIFTVTFTYDTHIRSM